MSEKERERERGTSDTDDKLFVNARSRGCLIYGPVRVNLHSRVSPYTCIFTCDPSFFDGYWKSWARHPVAQIVPDRRKCLLDCVSFLRLATVIPQLSFFLWMFSCVSFFLFLFFSFSLTTTAIDATFRPACSSTRT